MRCQDGNKVSEAAGARVRCCRRIIFFFVAIHGVLGVIFGVVLPCIINEFVYVMRLNHKIHFVLQA